MMKLYGGVIVNTWPPHSKNGLGSNLVAEWGRVVCAVCLCGFPVGKTCIRSVNAPVMDWQLVQVNPTSRPKSVGTGSCSFVKLR